jgi:hypothetical protein
MQRNQGSIAWANIITLYADADCVDSSAAHSLRLAIIKNETLRFSQTGIHCRGAMQYRGSAASHQLCISSFVFVIYEFLVI